MTPAFRTMLLLADRAARLDDLTSQFRERRDGVSAGAATALLAVVAGILVVFWLAARWAERHGRSRSGNHPWRLFVSLARAHGLRWSEIGLLWRVARAERLSEPARLFLEPERLELDQAGPNFTQRAEVLQSLRERLFAGLANEAKKAEEPRSSGCIAAPDARGS